MSLILWVILGGIAGWLASVITNDNSQMGCLTNIVVGVIGSFVGGTLVRLLETGRFDLTAFNEFSLGSLLVSTLGAVIFLTVLKMFNRRSA